MHLAYAETFDPADGIITLDAEESAHILRTLRMRAGDAINVSDGCGHLYQCVISFIEKNTCILAVQSVLEPPQKRAYTIEIASALTKNPSRMEFFIEKAVESGIDVFTPLVFKRSERSIFKGDRFKRLAVSAMKQSQSLIVPHINEPQSFDDFLKGSASRNGIKLIAYKTTDAPHITEVLKPGTDVTVVIGPEGDITDEELEKARGRGYIAVHLGINRLRTETAALAACMAVNIFNKQ